MDTIDRRVLLIAVICFFPITAYRSHAQPDDSLTSPITTLDGFRKARALGDQADSLTEKSKHWRLAITWQSKHIEWLKLARKFASALRNVAHDPNDPRSKEYKTIHREMLDRFDHMDFYDRNGAGTYWEDSLTLPVAACVGLCDYPLFLDMMQDFHNRRVEDFLKEPAPVKRAESASPFGLRIRGGSYEQRVARWMDRRIRAFEGRVFSKDEIELIDLAVRQYAYLCRSESDDYNPVPGLVDLADRYTAPPILAEIDRRMKIESPPPPRRFPRLGKTVELTIHGDRFDQTGPSKVDFDTGVVVTNLLEWSNRKQQSAWMKRGGLDIAVDFHWKYLMNIIAFDFKLIEVPVARWEEKPVSWEQLEEFKIEKGALRVAHRGGDQMQYFIHAKATLPVTFAFRTREGGVGLLQLTGVEDIAENVREYSIRYRLDKTGQVEPW